MEPELEPGFDLNYPVPLSKELPGFSGSGSEPGSITTDHLSSIRDFSKFYKDIEKLNVLAFGERLNLKSQEKTIQSVHSYCYGTRL